jgi:hypothetical protein
MGNGGAFPGSLVDDKESGWPVGLQPLAPHVVVPYSLHNKWWMDGMESKVPVSAGFCLNPAQQTCCAVPSLMGLRIAHIFGPSCLAPAQ